MTNRDPDKWTGHVTIWIPAFGMDLKIKYRSGFGLKTNIASKRKTNVLTADVTESIDLHFDTFSDVAS